MSRYTYTKKMFRDMTTKDLVMRVTDIRIEIEKMNAVMAYFQEAFRAAEQVLNERGYKLT